MVANPRPGDNLRETTDRVRSIGEAAVDRSLASEQKHNPWPTLEEVLAWRPPPALLSTVGGDPVLVAGRATSVYGPPEVGKSWLALAAAAAAIQRGGNVALFDGETSPLDALRRLHKLPGPGGLSGAELVLAGGENAPMRHYSGVGNGEVLDALAWLAWDPSSDLSRSLVVFDTASAFGGATDDADAHRRWYEDLVRPFVERGIAVLVVDHATKRRAEDANFAGARGTGDKTAAFDNVIELTGTPWTPGAASSVTLTLVRSRHGDYGGRGKGAAIAALHGEPTSDGRLLLSFTAPAAPDARLEGIRREVLDVVAAAMPGGFRGYERLRDAIGGHHGDVDEALRSLERDGWLVVTRRPGRQTIYSATSRGLAAMEAETVNPAQVAQTPPKGVLASSRPPMGGGGVGGVGTPPRHKRNNAGDITAPEQPSLGDAFDGELAEAREALGW